MPFFSASPLLCGTTSSNSEIYTKRKISRKKDVEAPYSANRPWYTKSRFSPALIWQAEQAADFSGGVM